MADGEAIWPVSHRPNKRQTANRTATATRKREEAIINCNARLSPSVLIARYNRVAVVR